MAARIDESVVRGEIDNTRRGVVSGRVWLVGIEEPLVLDLAGDCWRDLAGRRCTFRNPNPLPLHHPPLAVQQTGEVGDITASRKVRVLDLPLEECLERKRLGLDVPEHMCNALYLEWYSDANGRVVIESGDYQLKVSLPEWEMTEDEERRQRELNGEAMQRFLQRLEARLRPDGPDGVPEDREMDEYEWERFMKRSDARTERFGELLDKFKDHPDRDRIVAQHMGWDKLAEALDDAGGSTEPPEWDVPDLDDWEEPEPDPARERIDWIRTEDGRVRHPLAYRCGELGLRMFRDTKSRGLDGGGHEESDPDVAEMSFKVHCASAKLAGGLADIARGSSLHETGFVVATLKRALALLHEALGAIDRVEAGGKMVDLVVDYRAEALAVRNDIVDLMNRLREGG